MTPSSGDTSSGQEPPQLTCVLEEEFTNMEEEQVGNPPQISESSSSDTESHQAAAYHQEEEPTMKNVAWADNAHLEEPLNENFQEEGSRLAVVSDESLLSSLREQSSGAPELEEEEEEVRPQNSIDKIEHFLQVQEAEKIDQTLDTTDEEIDTSTMTAGMVDDRASSVMAVQVADADAEGPLMQESNSVEKRETVAEPITEPEPPAPAIILPPCMNEEMIRERTMMYEATGSPESASQLLSLPIDALHCVASFLTPLEWANYGQTCVNANKICREIFRRVRMHGLKCAFEVITAWKLGQHADAKELAALYISAGIPIYPYSLGHSYHTVCWRLGVEAKDMQTKADIAAGASSLDEPSRDEGEISSTTESPVDRFYTERFRGRDGVSALKSYLEEKCLFWVGPIQTPTSPISGRWSSFTHSTTPRVLVPPVAAGGGDAPAVQQIQDPPARMVDFRPMAASNPSSPLSISSSPARSLSQSDLHSLNTASSPSKSPKVSVRIHRHLLDQHLLGRSSVDDEEGAMKSPPVSLAADFFHPHMGAYSISANSRSLISPPSRKVGPDSLLADPAFQAWAARAAATVHNRLGGQPVEDAEELAELQELYSQIFAVDRMSGVAAAAVDNPLQSEATAAPHPPALSQPPSSPQNSLAGSLEDSLLSSATPRNESLVLNSVDLEVYSASSGNLKGVEGASVLRRHLMTRFAFYQHRLEVLLLHGDSYSYEECMLDLWDEFLPLTANIHYYDRNTAVPRMSSLQKFLTQPCPKAIGTVQCEIERIKISSKKRKGVGMKNRLFPTYEYRLFIRDREHGKSNSNTSDDASEVEEDLGIRRDTVLMVAKNKGRKHVDTSGVVSMTPTSKKGANNYYLYTPQQGDVDTHFSDVNEMEDETPGNVNGVSLSRPPSSDKEAPVMLGRLQSNFIGTEFQIYTPRLRKDLPRKPLQRCASMGDSPSSYDDDLDYESGATSDTGTTTSRRRSRFGRLSLRRSSSFAPGSTSNGETSPRARNFSRQENSSVRSPRTNRRAIANSAEMSPDAECEEQLQRQPILCEEEDGVITYTANLLGSRPRIMDVCIPKVPTDVGASSIWRQYVENGDETDDCPPYNRMLHCFKQLQQRLESQNADNNGGDQDEDDADLPGDFGLLALQNRPPWWNVELGSFVLNFRGRVSVASVKNFQLCDRNDHDHIMLQFGRIQGRHSFTMDYQYPLTAVQAFSIAISSLQSKISFG